MNVSGRPDAQALTGGFLHYLTGDGVTLCLNSLLLSVLLRGLSPSHYGYFALIQSLNLWLIPVLQLGLMLSGPRLFAQSANSVRLVSRLLSFRLTCAICISLGAVSWSLFASDRLLALCVIASVPYYLCVSLQPDFICLSLNLTKAYVRLRLITAGLTLAFVSVGLTIHVQVWWIPLFSATALMVSGAVTYRTIWPSLSSAPSEAADLVTVSSRSLVKTLGATTLAQFCQIGYNTIDVVVLRASHNLSIQGVGEYCVASRATQLLATPLVALLLTVGPKMAEARVNGDRTQYAKLLQLFWFGSLTCGLIGASALLLIAPAFLEKLAGRPMPIAAEVLPVFAVTYALIGLHSPFSATLAYLGGERTYLAINAAALAVVGIACAILVPRRGYEGAALGLTLGALAILSISVASYLQVAKAERRLH